MDEIGFVMSVHPEITDEPVSEVVKAISKPIGSPPPMTVVIEDSVGFGTDVHAGDIHS